MPVAGVSDRTHQSADLTGSFTIFHSADKNRYLRKDSGTESPVDGTFEQYSQPHERAGRSRSGPQCPSLNARGNTQTATGAFEFVANSGWSRPRQPLLSTPNAGFAPVRRCGSQQAARIFFVDRPCFNLDAKRSRNFPADGNLHDAVPRRKDSVHEIRPQVLGNHGGDGVRRLPDADGSDFGGGGETANSESQALVGERSFFPVAFEKCCSITVGALI